MRACRFLLAAGVVACSSGSQSGGPSAPAAARQPEGAHRYLPLPHGHVYAYESRNEDTGVTGVFTIEASRPREGRVDLLVGGRVTQRLEVRPDGVANLEGGYVLKEPLTAGATYKGRFGTITIGAVDVTANVPAGQFVGCIETREEASMPGGQKRVVSVYCPDVGLVSLDAEAVTDEGLMHESVTLKSFGPRVELGPAEATAQPAQ